MKKTARRLRRGDFAIHQRPLPLDAPAIARGRSAVSHDTMARYCEGDWVLRAGLRDSAQRLRSVYPTGKLRVSNRPAGFHGAQCVPDAMLKRCPAHVELEIK